MLESRRARPGYSPSAPPLRYLPAGRVLFVHVSAATQVQPAPTPPAPPPARAALRLLVFEDSVYRCEHGRVSTDRAFLHFALHLREHVQQVEVLGRLDPRPGRSCYPLPDEVGFVPLPHYASLASPSTVPALLRSLGTAWSALGRADVAWLMGPHPVALVMAAVAPLRGTRVVLGVRQDLPAYARHRHPDRRWTHLAADLLEAAWRRLARRRAVVAVGPELAAAYARAPQVLQLGISLVPAAEVGNPATRGGYDGPLQVLSVGRLEAEKNPLLLADVLAGLRTDDDRWRLVVCGEGPLRDALHDRLALLGVADHADLRGYVPVDAGLREAYLSSHLLLHVSWTEGVPQVLYEAWSAGLPVVATDVGGVRRAAGDAALLLPAGDAAAAVAALRRAADDPRVRDRLVSAGLALARESTKEAALGRLAAVLAGQGPRARRAAAAAPRRRGPLPRSGPRRRGRR